MNKRSLLFSPVLLVSLLVPNVFADNPIIQTCYTADPAPMVYNGTVYVCIDHDSDNAPTNGYLLANWKCYSSTDMVNWTDHGVILAPGQFTWATTKDADAAQCIYRNGKFYLYVSTTASVGVSIGVAVSNSPTGPFHDTLGKPLIPTNLMTGCNATQSWRGLDPTVFIDDNGQAYLYWGNQVSYWVTLNADMISYSGSINCLPDNDTAAFGPNYQEGPWFYKRNAHYYLVYPGSFPEAIRYTMSTVPTGSWTYKGQIQPVQTSTGASSTNQAGICDFGGNSYFFYHNATLPGGTSYKRSVCLEQFTYNADSTIPAIPPTTSGVTVGVGHLNPYDTTRAVTICWESGVKTETCSEGGIDADSIHNGAYIKVKSVDFGAGASSFSARVASGATGGNIELHLDSLNGTLAGTCAVKSTGGWQTWATTTCTVTGMAGIHDLYFKFTGTGTGLLFSFSWWQFAAATGIRTTPAKPGESGNGIRVETDAGKITGIHVDLALPSSGRLNIALFDLQGRNLASLFAGQLSSQQHLAVPISTEIRPGAYLIKATLNGRSLINSKVLVN
jgi:hypothetical protein